MKINVEGSGIEEFLFQNSCDSEHELIRMPMPNEGYPLNEHNASIAGPSISPGVNPASFEGRDLNKTSYAAQLADFLVDPKILGFIDTKLPISRVPYMYGEKCDSIEAKRITSWIPYSPRQVPNYGGSRRDIIDKTAQMNRYNSLKAVVSIRSVLAINPRKDNSFEKLVIWYDIDGLPTKGTVSFREFSEHKFVDTLIGVKAKKGMKMLANEYLYDLICDAQWFFVTLPTFPGWKRIPVISNNQIEEKLLFFMDDSVGPSLLEYASEAIRTRRYRVVNGEQKHSYYYYTKAVPQHPMLKLVWALRTASLFLSLFSDNGINVKQVLVLEPSPNVSAENLIAMMKTQDYGSSSSLPLTLSDSPTSARKKYSMMLNQTSDGTVVFRDITLDNDKGSASIATNCIINDIMCTNGAEHSLHHLITVVSPYASRWFPQDTVLRLSFDDVSMQFDHDVDSSMLSSIAEAFDSILIQRVQDDPKLFYSCLNADIVKMIPDSIPDNRRGLYKMLMTIQSLVSKIFETSLFTEQNISVLVEMLSEVEDDICSRISSEFVDAVNECIRNQTIRLVDKRLCENYKMGTNTAIATDNILGLEPETIAEVIMPLMRHRVSFRNLIDALSCEDILYAPEKEHHNSRHKIPMTIEGRRTNIHVYSIYRNYLDEDVRQKIDNLPVQKYQLDRMSVPPADYLPMLLCNGQIVGKLMRYADEEDNSIFITGQMGSGKTYALAQRAALLADLNHRIIIFDFMGTFTYQRMCKMLPKSFVDQNVYFHNIESEGLPVNLFNLKGENRKVDRGVLMGVFSAGIDQLTSSQVDELTDIIHTFIPIHKSGEEAKPEFTSEQILQFLKKDYVGELCSKLRSIARGISEYTMSGDSWDQFFSKHGKISVISMEQSVETVIPLINMLFESLYNYQFKNHNIPLNVIMDEMPSDIILKITPLQKIIYAGRNYHMSFCSATQQYNAARNDKVGRLMGKIRNKIFFNPTSESETAVASALRYGDKKKKLFDAMGRGDCILKAMCYSHEEGKNNYITISGKICSYEKWQSFLSGNDTSTPNE